MRISMLSMAFGLASLMTMAGAGDVAQARPSRSGPEHMSGRMREFDHHGQHYRFHTYSSHYSSWSQRCWFPQYRCYGYYCPTQCCWYYWSGSYSCYVPYTYISTFAPTQVNQNTNTNTNTNVNVNLNNNNSIGGGPVPVVPSSAVPLPPGAVSTPPPPQKAGA